ncbi:MAG: type II secretion system F family protein [Parvibaculum sp.]
MLGNPFRATSTYIEAVYYDPDQRTTGRQYFHNGSVADVRRQLTGGGKTIVSLKEHVHRALNNQIYSSGERANFLRTLSAFIRAGVNPTQAVRSTVDMIDHRHKRAELQPAVDILDAGGSLADCLTRIPLLDTTTRSFLAAGVAVNSVAGIIDPLLTYRGSKTAIWRAITTGLAIAGFELVMAIASAAAMELGGFDWILTEMGNADAAGFAEKVEYARALNRGLLVAGILPFLYIGAVILLSTSDQAQARLAAGLVLDRTPFVGTLFRHLAIAETFTICAFMLRADAPFLLACTTARAATGCPPARDYWSRVLTLHRDHGEPVTAAISKATGLLTPWEQMPLAGHSATRHRDLAETMVSIAQDRLHAATVEANRLTRRLSLVILAYLAASIGLFIYLVVAQNSVTDTLFQGAR